MPSVDSTLPERRAAHEAETAQALTTLFNAQRAEAMAGRGLSDVWLPRTYQTVLERNTATAQDFARIVAARFEGEFDPDVMDAWLAANAEVTADGIHSRTVERVERAADEPQPLLAIGDLFTTLATVTAGTYAAQMVTTAANFGAQDAATKAGARTKTWQVNSGNPRSAHAAMSGETVDIRDNFSNGMAWPGDPAGGGENNANCACSVVFG